MSERHRDVCILQPGYLPWLGYFDQAKCADTFVLYDDVQFDKHGWRNRNRILMAGRPLWLTVPVAHSGRFGQLVRDTRIVPGSWASKHAKSIRQAYAKAPFFKDVFPAFEAYLLGKSYEWLVELDVDGHRLFGNFLGLARNTVFSSELGVQSDNRTQRLVDICTKLGASRYISSDASAEYMEDERWRLAGVDLVYQRYPHPRYDQNGDGFVSHLSALDALMYAGPRATAGFVGISHRKERA